MCVKMLLLDGHLFFGRDVLPNEQSEINHPPRVGQHQERLASGRGRVRNQEDVQTLQGYGFVRAQS